MRLMIAGVLMFFLTSPLWVFSSTETPTGLVDSRLGELAQLPISDESSQRIYLVRHGESTANVDFELDGKKVRYVSGRSLDVPLTEVGEAQIRELAENLGKRFPKQTQLVITSSPALRAQQTAKILFETLSKTHSSVTLVEEVYPELNERHLGDWEGRLRDEIYFKAEEPWRALPAAKKFFCPQVVGGESYAEVANRALSGVAEIYGRYAESTVIAVTSFNTINAAAIQMNDMNAFLSTEPGTDLSKLDLDNGDLVLLEIPRSQGFEGAKAVSHIHK